MIKKIISSNDSKQRLDIFCLEQLPNLNRSLVQKLIIDGKILVNSHKEKTGHKIKEGEVITIDFDETEHNKISKIDIPIVYEDNDCLVLNKPVGILSHSKGVYNHEATVATFIANKLTDLVGERAGIVHRLDRATSGLIICAKNQKALSWLQQQFAKRLVSKTYVAIINGQLNPSEAIVDMPIERNTHNPKQFRVGKNGKPAQTTYKVLKYNDKYALVELKPTTGRTHQLRVHLKQIGYPIVGDSLYGGEQASRMMLHALSLELILPTKENKKFMSNYPKEFNKFIKA